MNTTKIVEITFFIDLGLFLVQLMTIQVNR